MYPFELEKFIRERNYYLNYRDLLKVVSISDNPQINHVIYNDFDKNYQMWDKYGNYYSFKSDNNANFQRTRRK